MMRRHFSRGFRLQAEVLAVAIVAALAAVTIDAQEGFRFRSGVDLVNVTATVTDEDGRFVSGLGQDDFTVFEDGARQEVSHFSSDRVPVSLGILLDTSGSMTSEKMAAARSAIDRFIYDLLGADDELFFMQFANRPDLIQDFTTDRRRISRAVNSVGAQGGTAMYDAIADAVPVAQEGRNRKKAILVISDGNDTNSGTSVGELRQIIRQSEVMVYALGVDGTAVSVRRGPTIQLPPMPIPFPIPGRRPRGIPPIGGSGGVWSRGDERVNADALRQITDDTGGRTEIVRGFGDLEGATARLADELSKQYYLGYASTTEKDGKWHAIRVEVKDKRYTVRARRGYIAS
jgi:Ca-activated chloride channel family protein